MKLLISPMAAYRTYVSDEFRYLMRALIENHGWQHADSVQLRATPGTLENNLLRKFGETPEVILLWEDSFVHAHAAEIDRLRCYKCVFCEDVHYGPGAAKDLASAVFFICDAVLCSYKSTFVERFPDVAKHRQVVWIPHSASPRYRLPFNDRAKNKILLSGAINTVYPLRQEMLALSRRRELAIVHHPHPGHFVDYRSNDNVGRGYAKKINRYRVGFTDCSLYRYVLAKHFEIPATGALLLAESRIRCDLRRLGFVENEHYVATSSGKLEETLESLLDPANHPQLDRIRKRAQALIWERHKTSDRARQIDEVCSRKK